MANSIKTASAWVPILDAVYQQAALTNVLDGASELAKVSANAGEIIIPKMEMSGLGNYDRNKGYPTGNVTLTTESKKPNFDRGTKFNVDALDDEESVNLAFGKLAGEFIRTKVVPELDAFRMAKYATAAGTKAPAATFKTGDEVIKALSAAKNAMDDAEVPEEMRYLFIHPTLYRAITDLDTYKSKAAIEGFAGIIKVPQSRFVTAIDQKPGSPDGSENFGYVKNAHAANINFMVIDKSAVIQFQKHVKPKIVTPDDNQNADAWIFGYRNVGIAEVYENKTKGIYLSAQAAL